MGKEGWGNWIVEVWAESGALGCIQRGKGVVNSFMLNRR